MDRAALRDWRGRAGAGPGTARRRSRAQKAARDCSGGAARLRSVAPRVGPCPICGYDRTPAGADGAPCPACGLAPKEPSLAIPVPTWRGVREGLAAIPRGLQFLATTRGVKRWILPPALMTLAAFVATTWWLWTLVEGLIDRM